MVEMTEIPQPITAENIITKPVETLVPSFRPDAQARSRMQKPLALVRLTMAPFILASMLLGGSGKR